MKTIAEYMEEEARWCLEGHGASKTCRECACKAAERWRSEWAAASRKLARHRLQGRTETGALTVVLDILSAL